MNEFYPRTTKKGQFIYSSNQSSESEQPKKPE